MSGNTNLPIPAKKILTKEKREEIMAIILGRMGPEDRLPEVVIKEDYKGDKDTYLHIMAQMHRIPV